MTAAVGVMDLPPSDDGWSVNTLRAARAVLPPLCLCVSNWLFFETQRHRDHGERGQGVLAEA